jgi:hypothetical protein
MAIAWELQVIKYYQQYKEQEKVLIDGNDLFGALAHFRIARNFSGIAEQNNKDELIAIINSTILNKALTSEQKYIDLLDKFKWRYQKELISATSKILWFTDNKEQYIIYDTLALNNIVKIKGGISGDGQKKYYAFCNKWQDLFVENEKQIKIAAQRVKEFYLTTPNFKDENIDVMDTLWFRMRVLDVYLWGANR